MYHLLQESNPESPYSSCACLFLLLPSAYLPIHLLIPIEIVVYFEAKVILDTFRKFARLHEKMGVTYIVDPQAGRLSCLAIRRVHEPNTLA